VDGHTLTLPPFGTKACVTGMVGRRDGLSREEVIARQLPHHTVADGAQNPEYVIYPTEVEIPG
jgi:hypothetical protein